MHYYTVFLLTNEIKHMTSYTKSKSADTNATQACDNETESTITISMSTIDLEIINIIKVKLIAILQVIHSFLWFF